MIHFVRLRTTFETLRRVQGYPRIYPPSVIFSKFINGVLRGLKTSRPRERERDTDIESYVGRQTNSLCPSLLSTRQRIPVTRANIVSKFALSRFLSSNMAAIYVAKMLRRVTYTLCNCKNHYIVFSLGLRVEDSFSFFI